MFAWLFPQIRKELTAMASQLEELRAEVANLKQAVRDEKAQVDGRFAELETKIEDLLTQPPAEIDLSDVLTDLRSIRADVANFYEPAPVVEPQPTEPEIEPEAEVPVDGEFDEEEFDDVPTVIIAPVEPEA
jgi:Tfp pilus assembly protein PilO